MSKTIEEIETQWAKDHSYENYFEFLNLTRKCDTDHVFIMDGAVTQIAKRYAKSQTQELIEQNREIIAMIEHIFYKINFQNHFPTTSIKVKNLLTRYNHLKSNTNETDKI